MSLPEISSEVVESFYSILLGMEVELDADPLQFGPKRLNGKVAKARGMLTECESLYLKVSLWLQKYRSAHRTMELELDIQMKHLFANDPEVRAGRNVADRQALATMKLQDEVRSLSDVTRAQENLEYLITAIKSKKSDLKDVQGRLRDQIKLCQEELGLGQRWGSKPPPGTKAPNLDEAPGVDKTTLRDLHEMFNGTGVLEPDLASLSEPTSEDSASESTSEQPVDPEDRAPALVEESSELSDGDVDDFLSDIPGSDDSAPTNKKSIDDLLSGLEI
jgi:hypothetical protein